MTQDHTKALDDLIAAVEKGIEWFSWLDHEKALPYEMITLARDANHGSLDEAKALHEALLPDMLWEITPAGNVYIRNIQYDQLSRAFVTNNPARAWLIAILKAYRAQMDAITPISEK